MKSTTKREVLTGVITFLVYGILGFAASVLTSLPEAGLDSHAVFIIGSIASSAVLVGGIAFGIVFGRKRSNGYLIGLIASVVFFLGSGLGFFYTLSSIGVIDIHDTKFRSLYEPSITIIIAYAAVPYIAYAAAPYIHNTHSVILSHCKYMSRIGKIKSASMIFHQGVFWWTLTDSNR